MNQTEWVSILKENEVTVTFNKKDGTQRVMHCTLIPSVLPERTIVKEGTKKRSENTVSVWDLDSNSWRSFVIDNVISYKIKE